jgi:hypothetical protein
VSNSRRLVKRASVVDNSAMLRRFSGEGETLVGGEAVLSELRLRLGFIL